MWGGRFSKDMDAVFARLNSSFGYDRRLYDADIRGSTAYAKALTRAKIITEAECTLLTGGLEQVKREFDSCEFEVKPHDEDIHTAVERRLGEIVGVVAGKLHTGRSRNDQVATDTRLFVLDAIRATLDGVRELQRALVDRSEQQLDVLMPGYTHLQRAQPVLFSHWMMSFFWMLQRDYDRLTECSDHTSVLPLGSGALAGNAFGIDREFLARELGFKSVSPNSIDAVSDRDFIAEFLFDAALLAVHLSRLSEDLILYSSTEFGFVEVDDTYATGSSLMPQKRNPDSMELTRGKSARLIGHLMTLLTMLKGLPSSYNRDLQEDKEPLFDAVDTLGLLLPVVTGVIRTLRVQADRTRAALDAALLATDLAHYLVRQGVPFREAHRTVGEAVKLSETLGVRLAALSPENWRKISPKFGGDVNSVFDFERSISAREIIGGTGPLAVREQIRRAQQIIA